MNEERFSRRFGHGSKEHEITIREDAPEEVRGAILRMAEGDLSLSPGYLRDVLCTVLRQLPDRSNWSEYPNVWNECQYLIEGCPWYRVYDFVEVLYRGLATSDPAKATRWQDLINEYFLEAGVGWRMVNGLLETRGPEAFAAAVDIARDILAQAGLSTARQEIHEALRDLSRRLSPISPERSITRWRLWSVRQGRPLGRGGRRWVKSLTDTQTSCPRPWMRP